MKVVDPKDMTSYLEFNILESGVRFELNKEFRHKLRSSHFQFGFPDSEFGRIVYYRTYSRIMANGNQEDWPDTVIRVINGIFTIRKWWFRLHNLKWKDDEMQLLAIEMGLSMLRMQWLPPGRGMWIMGSDYVYARGGMSLYNCAYVEVTDLPEDSAWVMDALMSGVGVGFGISGQSFKLYSPNKKKTQIYEVKDSREGWVDSLRVLLQSYVNPKSPVVEFDYSQIRQEGAPLKGFGGTSSGSKPLEELHKRVRVYCDEFNSGLINETRLIADIQNAIGVCVVAGNIRRSAEIAIGNPNDSTFLDLKDYSKYPERETVGWMSNNSVRLSETDHFNDMLPQISERIINNGEPGIFNLINAQKYGRYGELMHDDATGLNPCGEITLESYETCNLAEVFPTRCKNIDDFNIALKSAVMYASTVSLYPTHSQKTNEVLARNRRIGISLSGITEWMATSRTNNCIEWMKTGYKLVRHYNNKLAAEAGVMSSIRVTTVKPSGSISQVVGVPSGMHFPTFSYAIRRINIGKYQPIFPLLVAAGFNYEPLIKGIHSDEFDKNRHKIYEKYNKESLEENHTVLCEDSDTYAFEIPLNLGSARPATKVSAWEQFQGLTMMSREWADNAVSCTIYFDRDKEAKDINHLLSMNVPQIKSVSMFPHVESGVYNQMPYEGIDESRYKELCAKLKPIEWHKLQGTDGMQERFCTNDTCVI